MSAHFQSWITGIILALSFSMAYAADEPRSIDAKSQAVERGFVGVFVAAAHPALAANLKDVLSPEQGLTVEEIEEASPAASAGIRVHDVLTSYDNQKLFSVEQFEKLVRSDRPGREVSCEILREGKLTRIPVVIGRLNPTDFRTWTPSPQAQPYRFGRPDRVPRRFLGRPVAAAEWDQFASLLLKKVGKDKFHAELELLDKDGKIHQHIFDGSREEIRSAVEENKELHPAERAHLLRSLNLHIPSDNSPFPHIWFEPGMGWYFEQPGGAFR